MRRDIWGQVRPVPDLLTADMVLHLRIALAGHAFYYIDEPLMAYAVHADQQSTSSPRFRRDQASAWEMFAFADREAERLRRRYLAQSLVSLAAADLRANRVTEAKESLAKALELGVRAAGAEGVLLDLAARRPEVARLALAAWRFRPHL
jgi:hypothetical protein